jgi:septal ring factor EnvC (AmiA/AmiB activator)
MVTIEKSTGDATQVARTAFPDAPIDPLSVFHIDRASRFDSESGRLQRPLEGNIRHSFGG